MNIQKSLLFKQKNKDCASLSLTINVPKVFHFPMIYDIYGITPLKSYEEINEFCLCFYTKQKLNFT